MIKDAVGITSLGVLVATIIFCFSQIKKQTAINLELANHILGDNLTIKKEQVRLDSVLTERAKEHWAISHVLSRKSDWEKGSRVAKMYKKKRRVNAIADSLAARR